MMVQRAADEVSVNPNQQYSLRGVSLSVRGPWSGETLVQSHEIRERAREHRESGMSCKNCHPVASTGGWIEFSSWRRSDQQKPIPRRSAKAQDRDREGEREKEREGEKERERQRQRDRERIES